MYDYNSNDTSSTLAVKEQQSLVQSSVARGGESSAVVLAEQAKAAVQARYVMAMERPRNIDSTRVNLINACKRPKFAASAIYKKPVGGSTIEGPSARFAEEVLRCLGNVLPEAYAVYEDDQKVTQRVSVTDLETNLTFCRDITIKKTVERRNVRQGQEIVSSRQNTTGQTVYIVKASEDEIYNKLNSMISKTQRNLALMLLPSDIKEEALEQCYRTINNIAAKDPAAERKRMVDAFHSIGVEPSEIEKYLDHPLKQVSVSELNDLRSIFTAIKEGESRWIDFVNARRESNSEKTYADKSATERAERDSAAEKVKAKLERKKKRAERKAEKSIEGPESEPAPEPEPEPEQESEPDGQAFLSLPQTVKFLKENSREDLNVLNSWASDESHMLAMVELVNESMMPLDNMKEGFLELVGDRMK